MTTNYAQSVDHLVNSMKQTTGNPPYSNDNNSRKSFDELYEEFSSKSIDDQVNNLKELGRKLVSQIDGIVDKLNVIIEDIEEEESNNKEYEITVDPETHKVLYNAELNEYKVVRRED